MYIYFSTCAHIVCDFCFVREGSRAMELGVCNCFVKYFIIVAFVIINFAFLYFVLELLSFSPAIAASLKLST